VKGASVSIAQRTFVLVVFAGAFISAAVLVFGFASLADVMLLTAGLSLKWKVGLAGLGLVALTLVDVLAIRKNRYCPLGLRRQTPKALMRQHSPATVAMIWGFDTGLAVTTFRVAAITWGALLMAALGLSPWWVGLGYGVGFVLPFVILLLTSTSNSRSNAQAAFGSKLEGLLKKRALLQSVSAAVLLTAAVVFLIRLFNSQFA
jgi:hypothetical protein